MRDKIIQQQNWEIDKQMCKNVWSVNMSMLIC